MPVIDVHPAPLDERCEDCGKYLLRTFDRKDRDLCAGHLVPLAKTPPTGPLFRLRHL